MRSPFLLLATAVTLATAAAPAQAATPMNLGPGVHPDVATDSNGTGHLVWDQPQANADDRTVYCRIPRGATACERSQAFPLPLETIGRSSFVFAPSPGRVVIVSSRCCATAANSNYVMQSTDGGTTFSAPTQIGNANLDSGAVFGPGDAIFGGDISTWQLAPLNANTTTEAALPHGLNIPTNGSGAIAGNTTPIAAFADGDNISFSRYSGAGDPNTPSNWVGPTPVGPGDDVTLAGGPAGLAMIYTTGTPGQQSIVARTFDGTTFGAPTTISETGSPIFADLNANPSTGELTALWVDNRSPNEWRIARSKDGGANWTPPLTLLRGDEADSRFNLQVGAGPDGTGFAVSDGQTGGSIVAAPLTPLEEKPEAAGQPDQVAQTTGGGLEIGLIAPTSCITPPQKIALRVTSKVKKKLSPTKRVKITVAVFSVGKKKVTDKRAAFKGIFSTSGFAAGSKHPLKAVVSLRPIKGGKVKKKTLKGTLTVCG